MSLLTKKLYLNNPFLTECEAVITQLSAQGVVTDQTVAYPEGGGQEGDFGYLELLNHDRGFLNIPFSAAKKGLGRTIYLDDFPIIQVENPIYHPIDPDKLETLKIGDKIKIKIDIQRRAKLTLAHSGLHLVLMSIEKKRPLISQSIKGCHITPEYGRIDFYTDKNFNSEELEEITQDVQRVIDRDEIISVYHHPQENEAWYWKCLDYTIPCGGTHLPSAKYLNKISLKRKNLGKNMERITVYFVDPILPIEKYNK